MGELADRYWSDVIGSRVIPDEPGQGGPYVSSHQLDAWAATRDRIAELEQRVDALEQKNESLTQLNALAETENDILRDLADRAEDALPDATLSRSQADHSVAMVLRTLREWREHHGIDGDQRNTVDAPSAVLNDRARVAAAERRAEEAWAAVSQLIMGGAVVTAMQTAYAGSGAQRFMCDVNGLDISVLNHRGPKDATLAVIASTHPPNPELLEAASIRLAQLYIDEKAKAEAKENAKDMTRRIVAAISECKRDGCADITIRMHPDDETAICEDHGLSPANDAGLMRIAGVPVLADASVSRWQFKIDAINQLAYAP